MNIFVDTSALLALLDADDLHHAQASSSWDLALAAGAALLTSNYVLVEALAVIQRRLGVDAVAALIDEVMPAFDVEWVTAEDHSAAVAALLAARRRDLSLVDCTSFLLMRRLGLVHAFAFDRHFAEQGFTAPA
jgi:predicted nucleic acid-binding protein